MGIIVSNILDLVKESGEDAIKEFISRYSCEREIEGGKVSLNPDIE